MTSDHQSCVSSSITAGIHVEVYTYTFNSWIIEPFAVALCRKLYIHMHGLTFETSIWLLAGSTRFSVCAQHEAHSAAMLCLRRCDVNHMGNNDIPNCAIDWSNYDISTLQAQEILLRIVHNISPTSSPVLQNYAPRIHFERLCIFNLVTYTLCCRTSDRQRRHFHNSQSET